MARNLFPLAVVLVLSLLVLPAARAADPALVAELQAVDKELGELRKTTVADPAVKAAQAGLVAALAKLKTVQDDVLLRTHPRGKELVPKYRKLLQQYRAQQQAAAAKPAPKP